MSTTEKPLRLSLIRREQKVEIETEKGKPATIFTLRELDGKSRDVHQARCMKAGKFDDKGKLVELNVGTLQASLLTVSLFDPLGNPVPEETFSTWPARVIEGLCEIAEKFTAPDEAPNKT